jgi:sorbitol-specific phosphotransferase system component IIA
MILKSIVLAGVCLLVVSAAPPSSAQGGCASAPDAAVQCFVGNAVRTNLVTLQYGMTMTQFKAYGVSVSKIVQEQPTALAVVGLASAVADALPPTNANGTANQAAQTTAIDAIVDAGLANNILILPAETTPQDLKWFSLDLVNVMNTNNGILLSPGTMLRVIDSYVVTANVNGQINWTQANTGIATMITNFASAGLLKLPTTITTAQAIQFAEALAQITYSYKAATGRTTL